MGMTNHTIEVAHSPSLRARLMQGMIALMTDVRKIHHGNYQRHRDKLERMSTYVPRLKSLCYDPVTLDGFTAEWMTPAGSGSDRVLYYLHGGRYAICSVSTQRCLIASIAHTAAANAFAINYRLAPEHPFPAAVDDAVKGYEYLLEKGFSPKKIFVAGDSAGGGLTMATLLKLKEKGVPLPAAAVCISPWTDLEGIGESHINNAATDKLLNLESVKLWGVAYAGKESLR